MSLSLRIRKASQRLENIDLDFWFFEICGSIPVPHADFSVVWRLSAMDVTDAAQSMPVRCAIEALQGAHGEFESISSESIPYTNAVLTDWTQVGGVPPDFLIFPRRGTRSVKVLCQTVSSADGSVLHSADALISHVSKEDGYLDQRDKRRKSHALIVGMAVALASADGSSDTQEVEALRKWIRNTSSSFGEEHREYLEAELKRTHVMLRSKEGIVLKPLCTALRDIGTLADRYTALDLCLQITGADGTATVSERKVLHAYAQWLEVDFERFRAQMNKLLPVAIYERGAITPEAIFGIEPGMDRDAIRARINTEFKKYNGLVTHSNQTIRTDAETKLRMLVELRKKLCD